jgi:hypothetical protein
MDYGYSEAPFYYQPSIRLGASGSMSQWTINLPDWVTKTISTVTFQWSGTPSLAFTNRAVAYAYPASVGRALENSTLNSLNYVALPTNGIVTETFTNDFRTNLCLKQLKADNLGNTLTNTSGTIRVLKWDVRAVGTHRY